MTQLSIVHVPIPVCRKFQEFAGLGGDVGFFKNDVELQANLPLSSVVEQCSIQVTV